jgi:hypothetical protein
VIVALTVSLHGPFSLRVFTQRARRAHAAFAIARVSARD